MRAVASQRSATPFVLPAATQGIVSAEPLMQMSPLGCLYAYNLIPRQYGLEVRKGSQEWANGFTSTDHTTVIPYSGDASSSLFLATNVGIYDVSTEDDTSPTLVQAWAITGPGFDVGFSSGFAVVSTAGQAGMCSYVQFTTTSGIWLLVCDVGNGYHTYDGTTWTDISTEVTGVDPDHLVGVTTWANRVWFVEEGSASAWYLGVGAVTGAATEFNFGSRFQRGGVLRGLFNWTVDGGNGINDHLVALSSTGDVVIYSGTDPDDPATFSHVGTWNVGAIPVGPAEAVQVNGDIMILSEAGVISLSALLSGGAAAAANVAKEIMRDLRTLISSYYTTDGWGLYHNPLDGLLVLTVPERTGYAGLQYVMNTTTGKWGAWRDLDIASVAVWEGAMFFSTHDDLFFKYSGSADNAMISGTPAAQAINWSMLSAYSDFGAPAQNKMIDFVRPMFVTRGVPVTSLQVRYDLDLAEVLNSPIYAGGGVGTWDVSAWDAVVWGGATANKPAVGGSGMGTMAAIAMRGSSAAETTLAGFEGTFHAGFVL